MPKLPFPSFFTISYRLARTLGVFLDDSFFLYDILTKSLSCRLGTLPVISITINYSSASNLRRVTLITLVNTNYRLKKYMQIMLLVSNGSSYVVNPWCRYIKLWNMFSLQWHSGHFLASFVTHEHIMCIVLSS